MIEREMIDGLWPRPKKDANNDGTITSAETFWYYVKMIPWSIAALVFPVLVHAVKTGVADLLPIAVDTAAQLAMSTLTGDEKAVNFNETMKTAAIKEGIELGTSELNWLRENAVQIIKGQ